MLIIGAKGFAKEVLEILHQQNTLEEIAFYDDLNKDIGDLMYNKFTILKSEKEVSIFFKNTCNKFIIGIGNPKLRHKLFKNFSSLGGVLTSSISPLAVIGSFDVQIGIGSNILSGSVFSNSTEIGICCIVYYNSIITHDCKIGDFVEISPGVNLLGNVKVGEFSQIGANTTILPNITIGKNVIIGAGAVVTKNIPDNTMVMGIPAKVVKLLEPLKF